MKVLFLVPYPVGQAPSQRFRFEQYFTSLSSAGHTYSVSSFLSLKAWKSLYTPGGIIGKFGSVLFGLVKRWGLLPFVYQYDFVFVHREASPLGPPIIEWIIAKVFQKKIIYDFDDAIWQTDKIGESAIEEWFRYRKKVALICQWSYRVSCGNEYLCNFARTFNKLVTLVPTTIDTLREHNPARFPKATTHDKLVIGWTGTHSTLKYLLTLQQVLEKIEKKYPYVSILVIANKPPNFMLSSLEFTQWRKESEILDLLKIDVGIMPLPDDEWAKGKCGFKALQYMALGIPTVASPVGVNVDIINHGVNGFLCSTETEWMEALECLINDPILRNTIGAAGSKRVSESYSVTSTESLFLSLFE